MRNYFCNTCNFKFNAGTHRYDRIKWGNGKPFCHFCGHRLSWKKKKKKNPQQLCKRFVLTDKEYRKFKIALKMNKLFIRIFANRLGFNYDSFRTEISNKNRQRLAEKYYKPIIKYTNDVYELINEGVNPRGMVVLEHPSLDSYKQIGYVSQKEIEQIMAKTIPSLYEYMKSPDVVYLAVQSVRKDKIIKIRDYFTKLEYSVVKKVAHLENKGNDKKRSVVVLVAKAVDKDKLMDEYGTCLEAITVTTGG